MKQSVVVAMFAGLTLSLGACSTPQFQTLKIFDSPNRVVALRAMPDAYGGKGYDHPVSFTKEEMIQIMQGIRAEKSGLYSASSSRSSPSQPVFSPAEIQFFAPLIVKGLSQATPEEMVTFFETAIKFANYSTFTSVLRGNGQQTRHFPPCKSADSFYIISMNRRELFFQVEEFLNGGLSNHQLGQTQVYTLEESLLQSIKATPLSKIFHHGYEYVSEQLELPQILFLQQLSTNKPSTARCVLCGY